MVTGRLTFFATVLVIAAASGLAWYNADRWWPAPAPPGRGNPANAIIPVVAGEVAQRDVPIYLSGLGSVVAFNTATVKPQVDGKLIQVNFQEGQDVKAGDVLALIDSRPFEATLRQMEANQKRDQAQLVNARADLARYRDLSRRDFASRQSVDTQQAQVGQLEATVASDQAQIDNARVNLDYTTIRAPFDGRTGIRLVDAGNVVHATDTTGIVIVTQVQPISVVFTLPADSLPAVSRAAAAGPLPVLAFSRDNQTKLGEGTLAVIDNVIDATTGTIKIKATFANSERALWPGQFVNARLLLDTRRNGVAVPAAVVQRGPQGTYAFVVKPDQTVEMRPITVEQVQDGAALIAEGLKPGERVVVDGQYRLQPGSKVAPSGRGTSPPGDGDGDGVAKTAPAQPVGQHPGKTS
ncbi:MAG TPA: efflux RND transporter periplasmic adaptor subunit [Stellaceae bacterium]|jgi:multidrug efflux system membrane fusion protein|nr:efflux RND transporter periplasmic adaptor subunit [Stellaceae bacterium]